MDRALSRPRLADVLAVRQDPWPRLGSFFEVTDTERADLMSLLAASRDDLERWARFVSDHDSDLQQVRSEAGLLVDRATSVAVAEWSYGHAERVQAEVWLGGSDYGHLSAGWRRLLPSERSVDETSR